MWLAGNRYSCGPSGSGRRGPIRNTPNNGGPSGPSGPNGPSGPSGPFNEASIGTIGFEKSEKERMKDEYFGVKDERNCESRKRHPDAKKLNELQAKTIEAMRGYHDAFPLAKKEGNVRNFIEIEELQKDIKKFEEFNTGRKVRLNDYQLQLDSLKDDPSHDTMTRVSELRK